MMKHIVVDASVGIKTRVAEPHSDRAVAVLRTITRGTEIWVPDLFFVECANVLWKYVRRAGYPLETAQADIFHLVNLPLTAIPTDEFVTEALKLALAHDITVYDACYLALALRESAELVTADEKLIHKLAPYDYPIHFLAHLTDQKLFS